MYNSFDLTRIRSASSSQHQTVVVYNDRVRLCKTYNQLFNTFQYTGRQTWRLIATCGIEHGATPEKATLLAYDVVLSVLAFVQMRRSARGQEAHPRSSSRFPLRLLSHVDDNWTSVGSGVITRCNHTV